MSEEIKDLLSEEEWARLKRTLEHFQSEPDFATGEERGMSFDRLEFGQKLPLEIVLRDWRTDLDEGKGDRAYFDGTCFDIWVKLNRAGIEWREE